MKIKAEKVKAKELRTGDLFSTASQEYWDHFDLKESVGERVFIRTSALCSADQEDELTYRITMEGIDND